MIKGPPVPELYALNNLLYTTVRIQTFDENGDATGVGTAFFFHFDFFDKNDQQSRLEVLITNKHVIEEAKKAKIILHLDPLIDGLPTGGTYELTIDDFESKFLLHPHGDIDLCCIKIDEFLRKIRADTGKNVHYQALTTNHIPFDDELKMMFPISDVYMIGYPIGLWDEVNNLPIARKGVTASHPFYDFNGKSRGAVDIATFAGSSGSPIIAYELAVPRYDAPPEIKFHLLGILESAAYLDNEGRLVEKDIPTKMETIPITPLMIHLGYYIKAREILELEKLVV